MRIHFINVGYGEAILVERGGYTILIDGGTGRAEEYETPGCIRAAEYMNKVGISKIDLVIVTHIHDDHIGGIPEVIRNFDVKQVWINVKPDRIDMEKVESFESVRNGSLSSILFRNALASYGELLDDCDVRGIPVLQKGKEDGFLSPSEGFSIELLTPDGRIQEKVMADYRLLQSETNLKKAEALFRKIDQFANQSSISLRIKAGKTAALLTGDKSEGWEEVCGQKEADLKSQILKLTHHGQRDGMPPVLVSVTRPEIFVICSSVDRRFDSAHPDVIERANSFLAESGRKGGVYITGCLTDAPGAEASEGIEFCGVCFSCDEETGEITASYTKLS